ncbi:glycosyltransferase [Tsukamurella sp. 8F]|uniref:glycosyltransferase n=1 Tax=unclassified Tsukamurella TaxID=2633480 RepID=UPI0023B92E3C|nr:MULTISPECIES: glycosyltransferase [unclassified Tsukamurella]MDF0531094.1 glycosyltransferase [Tsukamurella sp. 8J]MDF0585439.1 glycosyltransferase [Tsukamurella sp. 8F]
MTSRLRILHVVTLASPDGAFGGPLTVALAQARALADAGHDVTVAAGARGYTELPGELGGVPAALFPVRRVAPIPGFAPLWPIGMRRWLRARLADFDIVHVHLARDLVTMPAALLARRMGVPYCVQTHGMVVPGRRAYALIDAPVTRSVLESARTVLALSADEREQVDEIARSNARISLLHNGIRVSEVARSRSGRPMAAFLARLHPRKRPEVFAEIARQLLGQGVDADFVLYGPPEGAEGAVDAVIGAAGDDGRLRRTGAVAPDRVAETLAGADVLIVTAEREPFGMTVLEALAVGTPVIMRSDGGLADFVERSGAGLVVDGDVASFAAATAALLADREAAAAMGARGREAVAQAYGMDGVVRILSRAYGGAG